MGADPSLSCCHRPCAGRRALDWPIYPELRRAFTAAMQPEQSLLLGEERNLLKFTEQTAGELADSARSMWEDFTLPATPESARTAHGQPSPPAYARTDSYTPGFPLQFRCPGRAVKPPATAGAPIRWAALATTSHRQRPGCGTGHAGAGRRGRCGAHGGQP